MADDDDEREGEASDPTVAAPGPRRSTFTAPQGSRAPELHDDDELAQALADDLARLYTRPIPVVPQVAPPPRPEDRVELDEPEHEPAPEHVPVRSQERVAWSEPIASSIDEPVDFDTEPPRTDDRAEPSEPEPTPATPPPFVVPSAADFRVDAPADPPPAASVPPLPSFAPPPEPERESESEPQPEPVRGAERAPEAVWLPETELPSPPSTTEPPAWVMAPAPDPAHAVPLDSPPQAPVRRSLPDEELVRWVEDAGREPGGTLNVIEQLESQLRLREDEAREFRSWESTMHALGTPEALEAVEEARPQFSGVLPELAQPTTLPPAPVTAPDTGAFVIPDVQVGQWPSPAAPESPAEVEALAEAESPAEVEAPAAADSPAWPEPAWAELPAEPEPEVAATDEAETEVEPREPSQVFEIPVIEAEAREHEVEELLAATATVPGSPLEHLGPTADLGADSSPIEQTEATLHDGIDAEALAGAEAETGMEPDAEADVAPDMEATAEADADTEAEVQPESEAVPEVGADAEIAPAAEAEAGPDHDADVRPPFAPPPLIEPPAPGEGQASAQPVFPPPTGFPLVMQEAPDSGSTPVTPSTPASPSAFSFDELLSGSESPAEFEEEPPLRAEPNDDVVAVEELFIEPLPVTADDGIPTDTGTVRIVDRAYDEDAADDAVDEIDRAVPGSSEPVAVAPVALPSGPIATLRIPEHELVLVDDEPRLPRAFSLEAAGLEPTPDEQRAAHSLRLFWMWFSANSSILSLGLGAVVFAVGMSLRQAIVAVLAGVALSFLPLGLSTLAGKRSGQPTMVVSRATFGLLGNILPAVIALVSRVFWGAVMLWLLASSVVIVLVAAGLDGGLGDGALLLIGLGAGLVLATLAAFTGYGLLVRIQVVLGAISAVLIVGLIALTASRIDIDEALTNPDGPWILTVTGAVLVFSFVGLVWAHSGADLARYQPSGSSGAGAMLSSSFGATLPAFALIGYGALLAASDPAIATGFATAPLDTLAGLLPLWYPVPLLAATALSLLSGVIITLYSGGFALQSLGLKIARAWNVLAVAALTAAMAAVLAFGAGTLNEVFRDVATTLAVPTAAWAGIFAAELMIRNRRFETQSLLKRGGVYPDVHWINTVALVVISLIGFGLTTASVGWLSWQGYLFTLLGVPLDGDLAGTDLGVLVALALGLIVPLALGIRTIRRQEAIEV